MAIVQSNDSKFATRKWIVSQNISDGATHTTIQAGINAASSGDTVSVKPGTYTENISLKAGVYLEGVEGQSILVGKMTGPAGTTGIKIISMTLRTNSDYIYEVTGTDQSDVIFESCYFDATNATAINITSSGTTGTRLKRCNGNLGTTGIAYFTISGSDTHILRIEECYLDNLGSSTTPSTFRGLQVNFNFTTFVNAFSTSNSSVFQATFTNFNASVTAITHGGSSSVNNVMSNCKVDSLTAASISVSSGSALIISNSVIKSSATNPITGAGSIKLTGISFSSTGYQINTTTRTFGRELGQYNLIATATASASSEIIFTDLSSNYREYKIVINNFVSSAAGIPLFQLSADNGSTWIATNYYTWRRVADITSSALVSQYQVAGTYFEMANGSPSAAPYLNNMTVELRNHASAASKSLITEYSLYNATNVYGGRSTHVLVTASAVNAIRFYQASGTITTGDYYLYGVLA